MPPSSPWCNGELGIEAAEDVCSGEGIERHHVLEMLSRLVRKSLVVVDSERVNARRYRCLETCCRSRPACASCGMTSRGRARTLQKCCR